MTTLPNDAPKRAEQASLQLTWIGHATVLLEVLGHRLITDPLLTRRVAHLRRRTPLPAQQTEEVDLVLVSHIHMDHLHLPSLRKICRSADLICPRGAKKLARRAGFARVTELEAGDRFADPPFVVRATRAVHQAGRGPHSRVEASPVGYIIEARGKRIYFAGDTELFDDMADLGQIDVALLPIWGWGSSLGHGHLDPRAAARATASIEPAWVVPIHWGTYAPEDGRRRIPDWFERPVEAFRTALEEVGHLDRLRLIVPGESVQLDG